MERIPAFCCACSMLWASDFQANQPSKQSMRGSHALIASVAFRRHIQNIQFRTRDPNTRKLLAQISRLHRPLTPICNFESCLLAKRRLFAARFFAFIGTEHSFPDTGFGVRLIARFWLRILERQHVKTARRADVLFGCNLELTTRTEVVRHNLPFPYLQYNTRNQGWEPILEL
jgi:hypothetical protein